MFDQIDAAYYRMRANEELDRSKDADSRQANRHRVRAALFEEKATALLARAVA